MTAKITLVSVPKPFHGKYDRIQRNAIKSWLALTPTPEIVLFGSAYRTADVAREFGLKHVPEIEYNPYQIPLVCSLFELSLEHTQAECFLLVGTDVILGNQIIGALQTARAIAKNYLLTGHSLALQTIPDLSSAVDMPATVSSLANSASATAPRVTDYLAISRNAVSLIPPLSFGKPVWKRWMLINSLLNGHTVIDTSRYVTAIHQNHGYEDTIWTTFERMCQSPEVKTELHIAQTALVGNVLTAVANELDEGGRLQTRVPDPAALNLLEKARSVLQTEKLNWSEHLRELGMKYMWEGCSALGLGYLDNAKQINPRTPGLSVFRGLCLLKLKRHAEATAAFESEFDNPVFGQQARELAQLCVEDLASTKL